MAPAVVPRWYCSTPHLGGSVRLPATGLVIGSTTAPLADRGSRRILSAKSSGLLNGRGSQGDHAVPTTSLLMSARGAVILPIQARRSLPSARSRWADVPGSHPLRR